MVVKPKSRAAEHINNLRERITNEVNKLTRRLDDPRHDYEKTQCKINILENFQEQLDDVALFIDSLDDDRKVYILKYAESLAAEPWQLRMEEEEVDTKFGYYTEKNSGAAYNGAVWLKTVKEVESEAI